MSLMYTNRPFKTKCNQNFEKQILLQGPAMKLFGGKGLLLLMSHPYT